MSSISRRDLIQALLGSSALMLPGCRQHPLPDEGELLAPNFKLGHRLRDSQWQAAIEAPQWQSVPVVIVGAGIAGLAAGYRLLKSGMRDFVILELERETGGTSRSGQTGKFLYPWGAHYITTPMAENVDLIELLCEMQIVEQVDPAGQPVVAEQYLCREPEERLFQNGRWIDGLYPADGATEEDQRQMQQFHETIRELSQRRDAEGRRGFAIPLASSSRDAQFTDLDQISMAQWLTQHGWDSERLRWYVDYACRDDYGLTIERTSAWAGIFYFAARVREQSQESQDVITWPAGNGQLVNYLTDKLKSHLVTDRMAFRIQPADSDDVVDRNVKKTEENGHKPTTGLRVWACDGQSERVYGYHAEQVIFAAPQFTAPHIIADFAAARGQQSAQFHYSSWLVANVHLKSRPIEPGLAMCWDNVLYESRSLGYVVSTHQTGADHGPTVITWYYPMADIEGKLSREQLLQVGWREWADVALTDLERAHADIRSLVTRIDIMRWGHAMIEPLPGFLWSESRQRAAEPLGEIHFANTDLSGLALMEEAFYHGTRAADAILSRRAQG